MKATQYSDGVIVTKFDNKRCAVKPVNGGIQVSFKRFRETDDKEQVGKYTNGKKTVYRLGTSTTAYTSGSRGTVTTGLSLTSECAYALMRTLMRMFTDGTLTVREDA